MRPERFERIAWILVALQLLLAACGSGGGGGDAASGRFASEGAYVQDVRMTQATIAVLTEGETTFAVELYEETDEAGSGPAREPARVVTEPDAPTVHQLTLEGLEPDTRYWYIVRDVTGYVVGEGSLSTAPPSGTRAITFAVLGDSGAIERGRQGAVVQRILAHGEVDLVLHTGDLVYPQGERQHYRAAFFVPFAPLIANVPFYACIGNHDAATEAAAPLLEVFHLPTNDLDGSERFYSFEYGSVHFVCLDTSTSDLSPDGAQARWLDSDLASATAPWKIVFFHKSPFSEALHGDNRDVQNAFVPVFETYGVDMVFTGHDHNYQRFKPIGGIHYVVTGGGGKDLRGVHLTDDLLAAEVAYHFVYVTVDATSLQLQAVDVSGVIIDALELTR